MKIFFVILFFSFCCFSQTNNFPRGGSSGTPTPGNANAKLCSFTISSSSSSITNQKGGCASGNTLGGADNTVNFVGGYWTSGPNCTCNYIGTGTGDLGCKLTNTATTSSVTLRGFNGGTNIAIPFSVICHGD